MGPFSQAPICGSSARSLAANHIKRGRAPITGDQAWWQLGLPMKNATSGRQGHFLAEWTVIASRTLILLI